MTGSLKVIAKYGTPEEAHLLRNRLLAEGIPAFIDGETAAGWVWHFANAFGGAKVLVPEEHFAAAQAILAPDDEPMAGTPSMQTEGPAVSESEAERPSRRPIAEEASSASWRCANCRAEVDAAMDVCWACGAIREEAEPSAWPSEEEDAAEHKARERRALAPEIALFVVLFPPAFAYFLFTKLCRLLAPLVPDAGHHPSAGASEPGEAGAIAPDRAAPQPFEGEHADVVEREGPGALEDEEAQVLARQETRMPQHDETSSGDLVATRERELDALVLRAWRAALMGFFLLPPLVMTLYSTWLLIQYWSRRKGAHRRRDRRALWALAINVIAALCLGFLVALAIGGVWESLYERIRHVLGVTGPVEEPRVPSLGR
jgi:hypothetical protein